MIRQPNRGSRYYAAISAVAVVTLLALWQWASMHGFIRPIQFPPPSKIATSAVDIAVNGFPQGMTLLGHVVATLQRIFLGYIIALMLAVPLGFVLGSYGLLDRMSAPIVAFCRSVATLSLLPLAIVWFGTGEASKIFLIAYGCFFVMLSNAIDAVKLVDPLLLRAASTMDTPRHKIFFSVLMPATLPRLASGARVALGVGFMVIVGAEMIGTTEGLGALIMQARTFYRTDVTMVGMLVIGAVGLGLTTCLAQLERWLLPWEARSRAQST
jgi:ABC-type nitrate/sulfonate/bicarbonate transport system permease component